MFDFFKSTRTARTAPPAPGTPAPVSEPPAPETAATHRELLRLVVRDTLRKQGIPSDWIGSQIATRLQTGQTQPAHQIQLTVLKWSEALMRFAPLLQQQIQQALQQGEPAADARSVTIVWAYAPDCGYPYTSLPEPEYWSSAARKFDLPPTQRRFHEVDDDFATTVPSPLR